MNARTALATHQRRATLIAPRDPADPPITGATPPDDGTGTCPTYLPGTDIRCQAALHVDGVACHASGVRDGMRYHCTWWRAGS